MSVRRTGGDSLKTLRERIQSLGVDVATRVADASAGELSSQARSDFDAGRTAYGATRPRGRYGPLSLIRTGATRASLGFSAIGTAVIARLVPKYAKYLIGKYVILPAGRAAVPTKWTDAIDPIAMREVERSWEGK